MPGIFPALTSVGLLLASSVASPGSAAQTDRSVVPSFSYVEASGCEGLFLYTWNADRTEVLTVRIDRSKVRLADGTTTVDLATPGNGVAVQAELTSVGRETMPYCSEADQSTTARPSIRIAKAGTLKLVSRRQTVRPIMPVSVMLDNLVLVSPDGAETRAKRTVHFTAAVADLAP